MSTTTRPTIEVREATKADADAICDAHVAAWREGYRHVFSDTVLRADEFDSTRRQRWRRWEFDGVCFVAVVDGRVLGFAHVGPERDRADMARDRPVGRGEVYGFYLHPDGWGSGAALQLMATAERRLAELGYDEAVLWVLEDNPRGRAFYHKAGWHPTGERLIFDAYCDEPAPEVEYRRVLT